MKGYHKMKRFILLCLILAIVTTIFAFDDLWQQAAEIQRNSKGRVPGKTTITQKFPMGQGELVVVLAHTMGEDGKIVNEVLSTSINGTDVDDEMKSDLAKVREAITEQLSQSTDEDDDKDDLFLETDKKKLTVKRTKETKGINRNPCVAYDVTYSPTGKRVDSQFGKVWLNSNTGAPVLVELQVPNASIEIKRTDMKSYYKFDKNTNTNIVDSVNTVVEVEMMNMSFKQELVMKFSDYWTKP